MSGYAIIHDATRNEKTGKRFGEDQVPSEEEINKEVREAAENIVRPPKPKRNFFVEQDREKLKVDKYDLRNQPLDDQQ
jgi:hypothetical protein